MPTFELIGLVVLVALAWLWLDSLKARDAGIHAARSACESEDLQLLDETVSIAKLQAVRNDSGHIVLKRIYAFEFSDTGNNRRKGSVILLGHRVMVVNIGLRLVNSDRVLH